MNIGSSETKPRSQALGQILEQFAQALRADDLIDNEVVSRVGSLFASGKAIKPDAVRDALFPKKDDPEQ